MPTLNVSWPRGHIKRAHLAARMVEDMEAAGVVGELQSNGSREVLAPPPPKD